jgi:hypothetical protein
LFQRLQIFRTLSTTRGTRRARFVASIGSVGFADTHARRDFRRKLFEHGPSTRPERAQPLSIVIDC